MHALLLAAALCAADGTDAASQPPAWSGFRGNGASTTAVENLPLTWSAEKGIAWDVELPGYGQSSPVVWGDKLFVTAGKGDMKETLIVAAYNLADGKLLWKQELPATEKVKVSDYVSRSAPTPVVDADRVYAFFESGDVFALDHAGKLQWKRQLTQEYGAYQGNHGLGSSLALAEAGLILLIDHSGPSYLLCLDPASGKNQWKVDREPRISWSSPIVAGQGDDQEVLISSKGLVQAYRAANGELLWEQTGLDGNTIASPTVANDLVIVGSSDAAWNVALKRGPKIEDRIAWKADATSSFGSPLVHRGRAYFVNRSGVATAVEIASGKNIWTQRLPGSCWTSPIGAGDRVYFFTKDGSTMVMAAEGNEANVLAENSLPAEGIAYGVAVAPGAFVIRLGERLIKVVGEK